MRYRLLVALIVMICATAFAPAPFIKPNRGRTHGGEPLARLQGTWTVTSKERMSGGSLQKFGISNSQKLLIDKDGWQYVYDKGLGKGAAPKGKAGGLLYKIEIEAGQPHRFRVKRTTTERDYMVGILAFEGKSVKMMYKMSAVLASDQTTPTSFDPIPEGWYLMTIELDR